MEKTLYAAYLVWQTGMALVIAVAVPSPALATSRSGIPVSLNPSSTKLSLVGKAFVMCTLAGAAFLGFAEGRQRYCTWQFNEESAKARLESPPADNLPPVERKSIDQMLILREIASFAPGEPLTFTIEEHKEFQGSSRGLADGSRRMARLTSYGVTYTKKGNVPDSSRPEIVVRVLESPNSEWAKYRLKDVPTQDAKFFCGTSIKTVDRFGSRVLVRTMRRDRGRHVYWPSNNAIVVVSFFNQEEDEIVKQYLSKHPSSL